MEKLVWRTEKRKVKDLKLFEGNPRRMNYKQAQQLLQSLKKFNLVEIPAVDQNNRVLAGNMRILALKELGREEEEIDVRVPSRPLSEEEAREYLLRSNANVGSWDWELLANFDTELLVDVGFELSEIEKNLKQLETAVEELHEDTEYEFGTINYLVRIGDYTGEIDEALYNKIAEKIKQAGSVEEFLQGCVDEG